LFSSRHNRKKRPSAHQRKAHTPRAHAKTASNRRFTRTRLTAIESEDHYQDDESLSLQALLLSILGGITLLLPCAAVTALIGQQLTNAELLGTLRWSSLAQCFCLGVASMLILLAIPPIRRHILLPVYVFGHEFTHYIFVLICYGKVSEFQASKDGGYIIANRANILVSLSPYIVPLWALAIALIHGVLSLFLDLSALHSTFFALYVATWIFNIFWTIWMIPLGQSDLSSNGTFFSLTLIYLSNTLLLSVLLEFTRATPSLFTWFCDLINTHLHLVESAQGLLDR